MATATPSESTAAVPVRENMRGGLLASLVVLFKLRVVTLLLFAAFGGAMLGSAGTPGRGDLILLLITGTLSASGRRR